MVRASKGLKRGMRRKLKRRARERLTIEQVIKEFKPGDTVIITFNPSAHTVPISRYAGCVGTVQAQRGEAYQVAIRVGRMEKSLFIRPEHLTLHRKEE